MATAGPVQPPIAAEQRIGRARLHRLDDSLGHLLGVAEQHHGVVGDRTAGVDAGGSAFGPQVAAARDERQVRDAPEGDPAYSTTSWAPNTTVCGDRHAAVILR